jgi:S1-C subfamily serine protease
VASPVLENAISRGVMSSKTVIEDMSYRQLSIAINPGNSGGPVFDSAGRVIGLATLKSTKAESMGFSIPVEDLNAAIAKLAPAKHGMGSRHRTQVALKRLTTAGAPCIGRTRRSRGHLARLPRSRFKRQSAAYRGDPKAP